jgi:hypothetical protein
MHDQTVEDMVGFTLLGESGDCLSQRTIAASTTNVAPIDLGHLVSGQRRLRRQTRKAFPPDMARKGRGRRCA